MMHLLARPWLRLPHLLAIYATIAVGAPCALFTAHELAIFMRSFGPIGHFFTGAVLVLFILVLTFVFYKASYLHSRLSSLELHSAGKLLHSLTAINYGITPRDADEVARLKWLLRIEPRETLDRLMMLEIRETLNAMIKAADKTVFTDEALEALKEMNASLEKLDQSVGQKNTTAGNTFTSEFRILLTRLIEKYQQAHQSKS